MFRFLFGVWGNFKEYVVFTLLIIISLILISQSEKPAVRKVRTLAFGTFATVSSVVSDVFGGGGSKSENEYLRRKNAELMLQVNKLREYGITNSELKGLAGIKDTSKLPLEPALIVSKTLNHSLASITLNKGKSDGIEPGMPVINDQGLLGVIQFVSDHFSIARTLKNIDLKLTVKNERSRVDGVLRFNGSEIVIINVPKTYDMKPGDRIVTSELSSIVSIPIPVGVVKELSKIETGIFNEVKVIPYADYIRAENAFIIKVINNKEMNDLQLNFYKNQ